MERGLRLLHFVMVFPLSVGGSPFQYNMFQGSAHSAPDTRQRSKNWCAYVVHKNVSCAVVGGSEGFLQPELLPCPQELPSCAQQVVYQTHFRPLYKIAFKTVTELEWRCCPGYQGHDCMEVKDLKLIQVERLPQTPSTSGRFPIPYDRRTEHHRDRATGRDGRAGGQTREKTLAGQGGSQSAPHLEEEVQRLSQMVLDMQARMTDMASNLRLDFQEDASKMLVTLLGNARQPASARGGETEAIQMQDFSFAPEALPIDEVMNKINHVTHDLETKSNALDDLLGRVDLHDGQIRLLMEASQTPDSSTPAPPPSDVDLRGYVDAKVQALREELMEGMDIKLADLKNSCDYKIISVQEQCEGQDANYLSLAELLDSKESDLRREIQDLRATLADQGKLDPEGSGTAQTGVKNLEMEPSPSNRSLVGACLSVEKRLRNEQEEAITELKKTMEDKLATMEDKVNTFLVGPSNSLSHVGQKEGPGALQNDINSLKNSVQTLEQRLNVADHLRECKANLTALETLRQDLQSFRAVVDAMEMQIKAQISDVRTLEGQVLNNSGGVENLNGRLSHLKVHIGKLEDSLSGAVQQWSNSSRSPVEADAEQEARELLEVHGEQYQKLRQQLDGLRREVKAQGDRCEGKTQDIGAEVTHMDTRVVNVETLCSKLDPISESLQRIKDGLNKHVSGLWTWVNQLNVTARGHARDIAGLKGTYEALQNQISKVARNQQVRTNTSPGNDGAPENLGPSQDSSTSLKVSVRPMDTSLPQPPVLETGEAGPPGKMTSTKLPRGSDGSMLPVLGFAGAPASPLKSAESLKASPPLITDLNVPVRPPPQKPATTSDKVSFSAGLTLPPFQGEVGIVRFDKVLVNDGGHYDPHTGIFTAPTDGRYLLTAVLAAQRGRKVEAVLSVSDRTVQKLDSAGPSSEAAAAAESRGQCECRGSTSLSLVLSLRRGDRAAVVLTAGELAVSAQPQILSSFSAVLLYRSPSER